VAAFPVEANDQIMLVTNSGKVIRVPVEGIRFASRATKGVKIFTTAEGEHVVSVERIREPEDNGEEGDEDEAPDAPETGGGETPESEA
jgi:DNA gyrase subunit A